MINFKFIRWQNLLSTGNVFTEVRLDSHRTTLIIGTNGSGKSTILDALVFALFNKPFRKVKKGQLINSITGKNLLVEVEFERAGVVWMVRRGSKPNIFEILKDGELVSQSAENKDYQGYLESIMGMNQKAFSQIVILGAASFIPFMQLTVPDRREVIEDFLDIQVFSDMNVLLRSRLSENNSEFNAANRAVHEAQTKLEMTKEFNRKQTEGNQSLIAAKEKKIEELGQAGLTIIEHMEMTQAKIDTVVFSPENLKRLNEGMRLTENELSLLEHTMKIEQKAVEFLQRNDTCPTCHQPLIDKESHIRNHEIEIAKCSINGLGFRTALKNLNAAITTETETAKLLEKFKAMIVEDNREIDMFQRQAIGLLSEIEEMKSANKKTLTDTAPLEKDVKDKLSTLEVRQEITKVMDAAHTLLKDNGIKAVIIRQYIPIINSLINKYLAQMDFFVDFQINETFEETIKSRFRDEFSYESFSEGEKMRIDLAILFAWRTVAKMRNSTATNLLIFDEVLDSSLDQYGIDEFIRIIQSLTDQENIFIISHRGDAIGDKFDNVLRFNKVQGYSKLVEVA